MIEVCKNNYKKVLRRKIVGRIIDCERFNKESVLLINKNNNLSLKELNDYFYKIEDEYSEYCVGVELMKRKIISKERDNIYLINIVNYNIER